jgi:DUF971 family protein
VTPVSEARVTPAEIRKRGGEQITIRWGDAHESVYAARYLRGRCPCAQCVSEITGRRMVHEEHVPAGVRFGSANLVGNYALHFDFSDGHTTGIYAFDYLRRICPCDDCAGSAA